jgi:hypothetical protein
LLAPRTVLNVHQILVTALGVTERSGLVHRNVARLMDPPRHGAAPEQRCWNEHQLRQAERAGRMTAVAGR